MASGKTWMHICGPPAAFCAVHWQPGALSWWHTFARTVLLECWLWWALTSKMPAQPSTQEFDSWHSTCNGTLPAKKGLYVKLIVSWIHRHGLVCGLKWMLWIQPEKLLFGHHWDVCFQGASHRKGLFKTSGGASTATWPCFVQLLQLKTAQKSIKVLEKIHGRSAKFLSLP